jgi:hypothetical protein
VGTTKHRGQVDRLVNLPASLTGPPSLRRGEHAEHVPRVDATQLRLWPRVAATPWLTARTGPGLPTVKDDEGGRRSPSLENAPKLAAALGADCAAFNGCEFTHAR